MRFRPCIDLHNGKVKQIVGATLFDDQPDKLITNFETSTSASYFASIFKKDNIIGGHVIMLGPGNEKAAIEALREFPGGLQVGGGINPENAHYFLDAGASHLIVTSYIFKNGKIEWDNINKIKNSVGRFRLVFDISCRKVGKNYFVATDRWQKVSSVELNDTTLNLLAQHCAEFLVHAIDVEGKRSGIDEVLVEILSKAPLPVTYAGGISSIDHLEIIRKKGENRVDATIGSALDLFGGSLAYTEVVKWHRKYNT